MKPATKPGDSGTNTTATNDDDDVVDDDNNAAFVVVDDDDDDDKEEGEEISDIVAANEKIRQLQELVKSLGGLEPTKGADIPSSSSSSPPFPGQGDAFTVIMDTTKFASQLFLAIRKGKKIELTLSVAGPPWTVESWKPVD